MPRPIQLGKTNLAILAGDEDVRAWDDEELLRGQRRDRNGKWGGRPPKVVPKVVHDELVRRKLRKAYELLADSVEAAVRVLVEIATDDQADPAVRVKAATTILDKALPPKPVDVHLTHEPKWQVALEGGIRSVGELGRTIDATARDDEHDPDDSDTS